MSRYWFSPGEALDAAFRQIMRKQLRSAARALASDEPAALGIHRARRCLKRSGALVALIEPVYRRGRWAHEARTLKAAAQQLSGARDEQAKLDALERLMARFGASLPVAACQRLGLALEQKRARHEQAVGPDKVEDLTRTLDRLGQSFRRKRVRRLGDRALIEGVAAAYRRGRKTMRTAFATGRDEDFHAWRRNLQVHWRHMQLMERCWPAEMRVRAEAAKTISGHLGEDHDLWLLLCDLADPDLLLREADRKRLARACRTMQAGLREEARRLGEHLYAEKPRQLAKRLGHHWRCAVKWGVAAAPDRQVTGTDAPVVEAVPIAA
jgi:hypothetical protein